MKGVIGRVSKVRVRTYGRARPRCGPFGAGV